MPTLCIVDELRRREWLAVKRTVTHTAKAAGAKVYDARDPVKNKKYLQCVISLDERWKDNDPIVSDQPQSYYFLVLKNVNIDPSLGNKRYVLMIKDLEKTTEVIVF